MSRAASLTRPNRADSTDRDLAASRLFDELLSCDSAQQRDEIRTQLVELHLDLCDSLAGRYAGKGIERDDLVQVARIGLLQAINRYRPERGTFVGFAIPTITGELKRHFRDHGWTVRPPRRLQELRLRYLAVTDVATQEGLAAPSESELLRSLSIDRPTLAECQNLSAVYSPLSLDRTFSDEPDAEPAHRLASVDPDLDALPDRLSLRRAIAQLSPRQRAVLNWRFVEDNTQREIALRLGISQMQVSRILTQTLDDLRSGLSEDTEPLAS
ncbi:MAG: sigma-70 family RNA polymerase sigma factor [Propionicimonas sp.]